MTCQICNYFKNLFWGELIVVDEAANAAIPGRDQNAHLTISQRAGFAAQRGRWFAIKFCAFLTFSQNLIALTGMCAKTVNHCADAIAGASENVTTGG